MTSTPAQAASMEQDLTILQRALPAHMLVLMIQECKKAGFEVRADVEHHLNMAAAAPLSRIDMLSVRRIAGKIDSTARTLLHDLSPDDPRHGLYCCAQFILTLIDEGRWDDPRNQAVLVSLLLMEDVKDDRKDAQGNEAVWRVEEAKWQAEAKKMLRRANLLGLYLRPMCN